MCEKYRSLSLLSCPQGKSIGNADIVEDHLHSPTQIEHNIFFYFRQLIKKYIIHNKIIRFSHAFYTKHILLILLNISYMANKFLCNRLCYAYTTNVIITDMWQMCLLNLYRQSSRQYSNIYFL